MWHVLTANRESLSLVVNVVQTTSRPLACKRWIPWCCSHTTHHATTTAWLLLLADRVLFIEVAFGEELDAFLQTLLQYFLLYLHCFLSVEDGLNSDRGFLVARVLGVNSHNWENHFNCWHHSALPAVHVLSVFLPLCDGLLAVISLAKLASLPSISISPCTTPNRDSTCVVSLLAVVTAL